jgi:cell fate (sporulation/competence/biofilm development) regulator YmcA (YheA/YmcA/DUF963 family)
MKINNNLDMIIDIIKDSDIYKKYDHILEQVKINTDINMTVKEIKNIQKKIVNESHIGKDISLLENELACKNKALNDIPLYQDYIASSLELNDLIKNVIDRLQTYLNDLDI